MGRHSCSFFSVEYMGRIEYSTLSIGKYCLLKYVFAFENFIFDYHLIELLDIIYSFSSQTILFAKVGVVVIRRIRVKLLATTAVDSIFKCCVVFCCFFFCCFFFIVFNRRKLGLALHVNRR